MCTKALHKAQEAETALRSELNDQRDASNSLKQEVPLFFSSLCLDVYTIGSSRAPLTSVAGCLSSASTTASDEREVPTGHR
jgi:hypothetical protein